MKKLLITVIALIGFISLYAQNKEDGTFELIKLPYETDALEPVISEETVELHYGKHLLNYVNALNKLIVASPYKGSSLEEIIYNSSGPLFNNAGQVLNHNLFFTQFSPKGGGLPTGELARAIIGTWGSFDNFKKEFVKMGTQFFGSGWVWLSCDENGTLCITLEDDGSNPAVLGLLPLLGFDLWEHSYYLDYNNRKEEYLNALWEIIDWKVIAKRFEGWEFNFGG